VPDLFVDTGAFDAASDRSDRHHVSASDVFKTRGESGDLVTTDHVLVETWILLRARLGRDR
jgi:predicted nucleic acid-binding protein